MTNTICLKLPLNINAVPSKEFVNSHSGVSVVIEACEDGRTALHTFQAATRQDAAVAANDFYNCVVGTSSDETDATIATAYNSEWLGVQTRLISLLTPNIRTKVE